jgi:hypothetical protein
MTQTEKLQNLATLTGLSVSTIRNFYKGKFSQETQNKIEKALNPPKEEIPSIVSINPIPYEIEPPSVKDTIAVVAAVEQTLESPVEKTPVVTKISLGRRILNFFNFK